MGKSNDPERRYSEHLRKNRTANSYKKNWIQFLLNQGLKPILEIIKEVPMEEWKVWEKYYITYYNNRGNELTNIRQGGEGLGLGNRTSFKKGGTPWNKGIKGYSTSKKGQPVPGEVRKKISKTLTGRLNIGYSKEIFQIKDNKIINIFPSAAEAARVTGLNDSAIINASNGHSKTSGGYIWRKRYEYCRDFRKSKIR